MTETPDFININDFDELKSLLPSDLVREFKCQYYELLGCIERGETEKIISIRDAIFEKIIHLDDVTMDLKKRVELMIRDSRHDYRKIRHQLDFVERLSGEPVDSQPLPKNRFPLPQVDDSDSYQKPPLDDPVEEVQTEVPIQEVFEEVESEPMVPEPEVSEPVDHGLDQAPSSMPKKAPPNIDHILVAEPLNLNQELVELDQSFTQNPIPDIEWPIVEDPLVKKVSQEETSIPEKPASDHDDDLSDKTPERVKGSQEYYDQRSQRIRDYIDQKQRLGNVDVTDFSETDEGEGR